MIYFIYEAAARTAYFTETLPDARFVGSRVKDSVHLYVTEGTTTPVIPILRSPDSTPLLKSNLQKAVRRRETVIAVQSAILLLQRDPIDMLRLLSIIAVEDVAIVDCFPVLVWLLMAAPSYRLLTHDIDILLHTVYALCQSERAVCYGKQSVQDKCGDILRSISYRILYGDMDLLRGVINCLVNGLDEMIEVKYNQIDYSALPTQKF